MKNDTPSWTPGDHTDRSPSERIAAYHDGELPPAERRAVEDLLASDPSARAELEQLRTLSAELARFSPPRLPEGTLDAVRAEIDRLRDSTSLLRISGWAAGLAAVVLIGCSVMLGVGIDSASAATADPFSEASTLLHLQSDITFASEAEVPVETHLSQWITSELMAADANAPSEGS